MSKASELLEALGLATSKQIEKAGYDRTVVATIESIDDVATKTYTVKYGDARKTAKGTEDYKVGDQVYIIIPGEDTLDWQISSLAQGILIGDTWIEGKDIPSDELVSKMKWSGWSNDKNSLNLGGIYKNWVIDTIKNNKKLYIKVVFNIEEDLTGEETDNDEVYPDYGIELVFNDEIGIEKTINDMIGNPLAQATHEQLFCFNFTQEEIDKIKTLEEISLFRKNCSRISITDFQIYGTHSPDISKESAYPIECKIYKTVEKTNIQVTNNLLNDVSKTSITFTAQVSQGSVNLLEVNTTYQWERYDFDWDDLTWKWGAITSATEKNFKASNDNAIYPITKFKCIATYNNINYESTEIQVKSTNTDLVITPKMGEDGPRYYVTLTAEPPAEEWKIKNMPEGALIKGSLDSSTITIDASLISSPLEIYATDGKNYGTISLANVGRESSNIEVLNVATYMYNLGGELVGVSPRALEAKLYNSQGSLITEGVKWKWQFPSSNTLLIDTREPFSEETDQGSKCSFALESYYDIKKTNNAITVSATYEGVTYIHTATIGILRTGEPGTNGTDISCKIGVQHQNDAGQWGAIDYPAYEQVSTSTVSLNDTTNDLRFSVKLENVMNGTSLTPDSIMWFKWSSPDQSATSWTAGSDIMCAKVTYEEQTYYAYLPIARYYGDDKLKEGSGFAHVMYQPNGTNPSYYQNQFESENTSNPIESVMWNGVKGLNGTAKTLPTPPSTFSLIDGTPREISLTIALTKGLPEEEWPENATEIQKKTRIELPILFRYNAYGLAQVNAWDGSSVTLADGAVMAPMAGFGKKESNNSFSGVLLGEVSPINTDDGVLRRRGIFGQYYGHETFFLNSDDGSASFGIPGKSQIQFVPKSGTALIQSGNYDRTNGANTGMKIDLTNGSIDAPNFNIDKDGNASFEGHIIANSGQVGNMEIEAIGNMGRNLLLNSSFNINYKQWFTSGFTENDKIINSCLYIQGSKTVSKTIGQSISSRINVEDTEQEYTYSAEIKLDNYDASGADNSFLALYILRTYSNGSWQSEVSKGLSSYSGKGWQKIKFKTKLPTIDKEKNDPGSILAYIYARNFSGDLYAKNLKIETGNFATNWSPAPEDSVSSDASNDYSWRFSPTDGIFMWNGLQGDGSDTDSHLVFRIDKNSQGESQLFMRGNGEFTGKITANEGKIAGWNIKPLSLTSEKFFTSTSSRIGFFADYNPGSDFGADYGKEYGSISIGGSEKKNNWRIIAGSNFGVDAEGNMFASNATISGKLIATNGGKFGGLVADNESSLKWTKQSAVLTESGEDVTNIQYYPVNLSIQPETETLTKNGIGTAGYEYISGGVRARGLAAWLAHGSLTMTYDTTAPDDDPIEQGRVLYIDADKIIWRSNYLDHYNTVRWKDLIPYLINILGNPWENGSWEHYGNSLNILLNTTQNECRELITNKQYPGV